MADIAVENKETPVVEKEVVEETTAESLKKGDSAATAAEDVTESAAIAENGNADKGDEKKENGDSVADKPEETATPESTEEEHSNGDKKVVDDEDEDVEETNGDSTDAPAEAVKRKVEESKTDETATPEKKPKLDDSKDAAVEKEVNGAEATELAAEA